MDQLYTRRNISECIGAAWSLLSTNLLRITKSLWIPTLVFSLAYALSAVSSLCFVKDLSLGKNIIFDAVAIVVLCITCIAATLVIAAKTFKQLNEQNFKYCMSRSFKAFLVSLAFLLITTILTIAVFVGSIVLTQSGKMSPTASGIIALVLVVVITIASFVFFSPFNYSLTKYMIEPEMTLKKMWKSYRTGFNNLGFILGCSLICIVIMATVYNIMVLPGYIATISASLAYSGVANGDAANLPAYFPIILGATMFIAGLVYTTLLVWFIFVEYYQYASIEARNGRTDTKTEETDKTNG